MPRWAWVISFLPRSGRSCGRHADAMLTKYKRHALGQIGREQGVDGVVERRRGFGGQAVFWGVPRSEFGAVGRLFFKKGNTEFALLPIEYLASQRVKTHIIKIHRVPYVF